MTPAAPAGTHYELSMLSVTSSDSRPSLLVTFDSHRYLFNTPESISRVCLQNRIGMRKIGHVFVGDLSESGGMPGFLLSAVETGNKKIEVFGPSNIDHLIATYRYFTRREHLSLKVSPISASLNVDQIDDCEPTAGLAKSSRLRRIHEDRNLVVYCIPLTSRSNSAPNPPKLHHKRRRTSSSPSPPPRTRPSAPADAEATHSSLDGRMSSTPDSPAISDLLFDHSSPSFNPSQLRGAAAQQWRSLVLGDMFRGRSFADPSLTVPSTVKSGNYQQSPAYVSAALPSLDQDKTCRTVLSYLGVGPSLRGKFDPKEAQKRGVRPGAAFTRLVAGEKVWVPRMKVDSTESPQVKETKKERRKRLDEERLKLESVVDGEGDGEWVDPKDCIGPTKPGSAFVVLNLPTPEYLEDLLTYEPDSFLHVSPTGILRTIFYFLGAGVLNDPRLIEFISRFPADHPIAHRITSPDITSNDPVTFVASALLTLRLNRLDPTIFPLPHYSFLGSGRAAEVNLPKAPSSISSVTLLSSNDCFSQNHEPVPSTDNNRIPHRHFNFEVPSDEADLEAARLKGKEKAQSVQDAAQEAWASFEAAARETCEDVDREIAQHSHAKGAQQPGHNLQVTPLGTGSAIPSKYRNVSSTLLHIPDDGGYILLDAGEGTWGQIARRFGDHEKESKEKVLRGIKMIFISHMHQDHHAGLATILRERAKLSPPENAQLVVVGPPGIRVYLTEQQEMFDLGIRSSEGSSASVFFLDNMALEYGKEVKRDDWRASSLATMRDLLGLGSIVTVPVLHRCRCWGVVITHKTGWKVVFSGDTMPCEALAVAGRNASLLIHEATIEDGKEELARAKGHSTFGQAIDIARRMRARNLLLTHFSARYPKLPPVSTRQPLPKTSDEEHGMSDGLIEPTVAVAFDMATLRLDDFWKMSRYRNAMDLLLGWDEVDDAVSAEVPSVVEIVE